ncbi:hypothetical protein [Lentilactobacillus farraginis]|uniref:hypothetical protein n=1 Tax=Lentilactobacillus farraginis TaxID=390841 RepID=UPI00054E891C|nr:hypothetical protein [Lentilactobacillus farraginis]
MKEKKIAFLSLLIIMIIVIVWKTLLFTNVFPDTNILLGVAPDILGVLSILILLYFQRNIQSSEKGNFPMIGVLMTIITWITILI